MINASERRCRQRLKRDDRLFIQVIAASKNPSLVGQTFYCEAVDASEKGLQLSVNQDVAAASEVDLWVDVESSARKYFLRAVVRWCREQDSESHSYQLGIELQEQQKTDYEEWQLLFLGL